MLLSQPDTSPEDAVRALEAEPTMLKVPPPNTLQGREEPPIVVWPWALGVTLAVLCVLMWLSW